MVDDKEYTDNSLKEKYDSAVKKINNNKKADKVFAIIGYATDVGQVIEAFLTH